MLLCPDCRGELVYTFHPEGAYWRCERCGGLAVPETLMKRLFGEERIRALSSAAAPAPGAPWRPCPFCPRDLVGAAATPDPDFHSLAICPACRTVWYPASAAGAFSLPQQPPAAQPAYPAYPSPHQSVNVPTATSVPPGGSRPSALSPEQQERLAAAYEEAVAKQKRNEPFTPEVWWQWVLGLLGMPVKCDRTLERRPVATLGLASIIALISLIAIFGTDLHLTVQNIGFIPAQPFRHYGSTFLTFFLIHGGLAHLLGNLYFLILFGHSVEDHLGGIGFLALVLGAALAGNVLHAALDPRSLEPLIGASGGIAGLVAFYGLAFPRARLAFLLCFMFFFIKWIRVPAILYVILWFVLQMLGARTQIAGLTNTSYLAHLGGALAGAIFWLVWRRTGAEEAKATAGGGF